MFTEMNTRKQEIDGRYIEEQLTEKMKVGRKSRNDWQTKSEFSRNSETNHTKVYYQSIIKHPVFLPKSRFFAG